MQMMTQQQVQEINNKCKNNWEFNTTYYLCHQEKTLIKRIIIDDENYLEFKLGYNYKNQIQLRISKYYTQKHIGTATSEGLGKSKVLEETSYKRKGINNLIIKTQTLTDDELLKINAETKVINNGIFVPSSEF